MNHSFRDLDIVSVSAFCTNSEIANAVRASDHVRSETLNRCYALPGYREKSAAEKNAIYDEMRLKVEEELRFAAKQ